MKDIFTTLIFVMFLSVLALGIINISFKINPNFIKTHIHLVLLTLVLISIRMFLPFDFPFVRTIDIYTILPDIYMFLYNPVITVKHLSLSPFDLFNIVWVIGSVICLLKTFYRYISTLNAIHKLNQVSDSRIYQIIDNILKYYKKPIHFSVVSSEAITSPMIFGIFKPYIVLPQTPISDEDLYYILSHEIAHYYNYDLFIKLAMEVMHAIYWWNPLFYLIKKRLSKLLEINIDIKVTKRFNECQMLSYLICLLKIARSREKQKDNGFITSFNSDTTTAISKRIHIILDNFHTNRKYSFLNIITITFLLTITLIMPNFFTIVSIGEIPAYIEENYFEINKDNSFYIQLEDGTYDLYIEQNFTINMTSTDSIDEPIPVYSSIEEVLHQ